MAVKVQGLTLDTGALFAYERRDRPMWRIFTAAIRDDVKMTVSTLVLAQAHRGNSPLMYRMLAACEIEAGFSESTARKVGELLGSSATDDVVDAAVVLGAVARNDGILTSDVDDLERLVAALGATKRCPVKAV